ncbi:MAG TPA: iron chelate uptake ABC transporter family permease subunit [Candidatus Limnocylindrales bacterium]|nr:iron chelate uptake ABC transporter family permease subunit [Candidatus Limnocylindrales bacterium]
MSAGVSTPVSAPVVRVGRIEGLRRRPVMLAFAGLALCALVLALGVALGSVGIPLADTVGVLLHRLFGWPAVSWPASTETIVFELRLPRVLTAMAVGVGLALAGATFQGLLRNPLADPYVLGTASGAALGAAVAMTVPLQMVVLGIGLVNVSAFVGASLAVAVVYRLARAGGLGSMTSVLLTGYAVGALLAAALALVMYLSGNSLRQIFVYLLGSFALSSWPQVLIGLPIITLGSTVILLRARVLNAMLLGEETAGHLGLDVNRQRLVLLGAATLVTAAAVAMSGLIGFVGLVVPHLVRLVVGPNARTLLPLSAIYGAAFLGAADLLARLPGELPVGVVTAVVGAPFFLYLLRRYRASYAL